MVPPPLPFFTPGRRPTIPEIRAYYNSPAILEELIRGMQLWHVRFVPSSEPQSWIYSDKFGELQALLNRALDTMEDNPLFTEYPYFRINYARYKPAYSWEKSDLYGYDFVIEKDAPIWQECFEAMLPVMDILEYFDVYYWLKYTGHHSLHLVIPAEVFPAVIHNMALADWYEVVHHRLMVFLNRRSHQHFNQHDRHCPPGTNMPYSVNENTGLVNLPLKRKDLARFRPWQASIHLVEPSDDWRKVPENSIGKGEKLLEEVLKPTRNQQRYYAGISRFLQSADEGAPDKGENPHCPAFCLSRDKAVDQISSPVLHLRLYAAWSLMVNCTPDDMSCLVTALHDENADVRWFAAEGLARVGSLDQLSDMLQIPPDDMAGSALMDYCVRLGELALPYLFRALCVSFTSPYASLPIDRAMIRLGKASVPYLKMLLDQKKSALVKIAADMLQQIAGTPDIEKVLEWTQQHHRKSNAVKMLGWFDDNRVYSRIVELCQDVQNDRVRRESIKTLLWNDHPEARELLVRAKKDPSKKIRNWADRYLFLIEQLEALTDASL